MEKRTIELPLDKARQWYKQGGELKEAALQAYKEEELRNITYEDICKELFNKTFYDIDLFGRINRRTNGNDSELDCPNNGASYRQLEKLLAINKLVNVAKYLNGDWKPNWGAGNNKEKFYLYHNLADDIVYIKDAYYMTSHVVYFKNENLAQQAMDILGEDTIRLAISPYWD